MSKSKSHKKGLTGEPFESVGKNYWDSYGNLKAETSANIFESMLQSAAFKNLNARQRMLYIYCKAQYYGKRKPSKDYPDVKAFQRDDCFYLNWAAVDRYGLYTASDSSTFYKDMNVLCNHGLIERIASGKAQRKKTVYRYSDSWKTFSTCGK